MAKVGNERISHKGSGKYVYCQINFFGKTKHFQIVDFPEDIKLWYGAKQTREKEYGNHVFSGEITAKSYDECVALGNKIYSEFYDQNIREEKIICYQLKMNYPIPEFHGHRDRKDMHFSPNLAIGIQYKTVFRITIGEETFISDSCYEDCKQPEQGIRLGGAKMWREDGNSGMNDWTKIPYTEEANLFFKNVEKGLLEMITKVDSFFGSDSSVLLEKINSGKALMA